MLEIKSLTTAYTQAGRRAHALRDVSLTLRAGSATALVGESGCGKSTVAMSVMRMIRPPVGEIESGEITLSGESITNASSQEMRRILRDEIGFIPQDPTTALDPLFSIRSQIAEAMSKVDRGRRDEVAVELLTSLGVDRARERLREHPHQFSGGMRQRVAIAIALVNDPSLLIADEPTTALDVTTQLSILRLLDRLRQERNLTTLFITHDIRVARLVCQEVAVMYGGKVVEAGPIELVARAPRHPYTRALMEASALNVAPRQRLRTIVGSPPSIFAMGAGCPFASRCPRATSKCEHEPPLPVVDGKGATYSCWNPEA